jgi:uncharacterized protein (DUF362 family)
MTVVIKPNFVLDRHDGGGNLYSIITHPSIIKTVCDYASIALEGSGRIIIADAPQNNCNFNNLKNKLQLEEIKNAELINLQPYWSTWKHFKFCEKKLNGDPLGSTIIDLGSFSKFVSLKNKDRLYGARFKRKETERNHTEKVNKYQIANTVLFSDVLISLPKMKVHKKVGVTLNAKNLVGINTNKNLIPHYRIGSPKEGGDQYPDGFFSAKERFMIKFERFMYDMFLSRESIPLEHIHRFMYGFICLFFLKKIGLGVSNKKKMLDSGNWYGNDTCWRSVYDLLSILSKTNIKTFSIVDGIIGGENDGPLMPDSKPSGVLIGGENFSYVDAIATTVMGFDYKKIKYLSEICMEDIDIIGDLINCNYKPHPGWTGHIELKLK